MPPKVSSNHPLIFDWSRLKGGGSRLTLAVLAVLAGLTLFFYLFQVVYPESERFTPVPHEVVLLNATDPATKPIMNKVRDVDYLLLPPRQELDNSVSLPSLAPVFHPSFEGHPLSLQDLPHRPFTPQPARLIDPDEPALPALDMSELKDSPSPPAPKISNRPARLVMAFHGLAEDRLPRTVPDLSEVPLADLDSCRFRIGVNPDGRVSFALPIMAPDQPAVVNLLTERIRRLRFAPLPEAKQKEAAASQPQWGEVSFEWKTNS